MTGLCCFFCFKFWLLDFWQQAFGFGAGACLLKVEVEGVAAGDVT